MSKYADYPVLKECGIDETSFSVSGGPSRGVGMEPGFVRPFIKFSASEKLAENIYKEVDDHGRDTNDTQLGVLVVLRGRKGFAGPERWSSGRRTILDHYNPGQPFEPFNESGSIMIPMEVDKIDGELLRAISEPELIKSMKDDAEESKSEAMVYITPHTKEMTVREFMKTFADILKRKVAPKKKSPGRKSVPSPSPVEPDSLYELPRNLMSISKGRNPFLFRRATTNHGSESRTRTKRTKKRSTRTQRTPKKMTARRTNKRSGKRKTTRKTTRTARRTNKRSGKRKTTRKTTRTRKTPRKHLSH